MQNIFDRLVATSETEIGWLMNHALERAEGLGTESPIETLLLAAMVVKVTIAGVDLPAINDRFVFCKQELEQSYEKKKVLIMPQYVWGSYRVDIALYDSELPSGYIFVECDGHEFHERTPEQAEKDRSRDRALQIARIPILRFTGREIYRDAGACVEQVWKTLNAHTSRGRDG